MTEHTARQEEEDVQPSCPIGAQCSALRDGAVTMVGSNSIVTWRQVMLFIGAAIALSVGVTWSVLTVHANGTHPESVTYREFSALRQDVRDIKLLLQEK